MPSYDPSMAVKPKSKIQTVKLNSGRCRQVIKGEYSEQLNAIERKRRYAYVTVDKTNRAWRWCGYTKATKGKRLPGNALQW
jgi:hypothetical protein